MFNQLGSNDSCSAVQLIGICPWCMHVFAGSSDCVIAGFLGVPLVSSMSRVLMTSPAINGGKKVRIRSCHQPLASHPFRHAYTTSQPAIYRSACQPASQPARDATSQPVYYILGGCPFHGRVERDEIPTRESPPKQSGTLPCPALPCPALPCPAIPFPPLPSTPLPSPPLHSLPSACLLLCILMHTVCEVGELN